MSNGLQALLVAGASGLLGAVYVRYLGAVPFPPAILRLVPVVWLAGSLTSGAAAARALRRNRNRLAAGMALALDVPSAVLAVLFTMAALVGD